MGFGHSFIGKSGRQYSFLLTNISNLACLSPHGGLVAIVLTNPEHPLFIGAAESIQNDFRNFSIWPKTARIPDDAAFYIMNCEDARERYAALGDLLANYEPPLNRFKDIGIGGL
jgi:hypothetical protein